MEINRLLDQKNSTDEHIKEMESLIMNLRDEVDQKNMILEEYERSNNDSRMSERMTMNTPLISASDLSELK